MGPIKKLYQVAIEKKWHVYIAIGDVQYTPTQESIDIINDSSFRNDIIKTPKKSILLDIELLSCVIYTENNDVIAMGGTYKDKEWAVIFEKDKS